MPATLRPRARLPPTHNAPEAEPRGLGRRWDADAILDGRPHVSGVTVLDRAPPGPGELALQPSQLLFEVFQLALDRGDIRH